MGAGNDLPGVHFLSLFGSLFPGFIHVFHRLDDLGCLEIGSLHTLLELLEPAQQPCKLLGRFMAARKPAQKLLEEPRELRPGPAQRAADGRLDPRADHPACHGDLTLQALAELAFSLQLGMKLLEFLDTRRQRRQIEAIGLDDTPLGVPAAPPLAVRTVLKGNHTDLG